MADQKAVASALVPVQFDGRFMDGVGLMRRMVMGGAVAAAMMVVGPVQAAEDCPSSYICASNPQGIVNTLQTLGYKAVLGKSTQSENPKITSSASGYTFEIFFYGCDKGANCNSLGFMATFDKEEGNSAEFANSWNRDKRFSTMSFDPGDGSLTLSYDVSTAGGLNQVNFADAVSWWETMLGQARTYFANRPAVKK